MFCFPLYLLCILFIMKYTKEIIKEELLDKLDKLDTQEKIKKKNI